MKESVSSIPFDLLSLIFVLHFDKIDGYIAPIHQDWS